MLLHLLFYFEIDVDIGFFACPLSSGHPAHCFLLRSLLHLPLPLSHLSVSSLYLRVTPLPLPACSSVAKSVTGLVTGYAKTLKIDMGLCLEGKDESELPEVVMASCCAIHVDLTNPPQL